MKILQGLWHFVHLIFIFLFLFVFFFFNLLASSWRSQGFILSLVKSQELFYKFNIWSYNMSITLEAPYIYKICFGDWKFDRFTISPNYQF